MIKIELEVPKITLKRHKSLVVFRLGRTLDVPFVKSTDASMIWTFHKNTVGVMISVLI